MQTAGRGAAKPAIGIAFEGDLGQRIDAVLAVAMLNGFVAKGEARNIALCVSRPSLGTAQLADVIAGFYAPRPVGGTSMIGMPETGPAATDAPMVAATLAKTADDGKPRYTTNLARLLDTADNAVLIRNQLLAQNDLNAVIVVAGPATGIARLVGLYGAPPQIAAKVKLLVLAAGAFPAGPPETSITSDIAGAKKLFAEWPSPIVAVGAEVGTALPYPGASLDSDFAWAAAHPVADAYRAFKPMPYDAPASALAAALYAVHPDGGYFTLSEPGTITVQDDGRTKFTVGASGKHRYLVVDPAQRDRITALYREMVAAPPPARPGRGGRGQAPAAAQQAPAAQQAQPPQEQPQNPPQNQAAPADPAAK